MTFEVNFSPQAEQDVTEAVIYLHSHSPQSARKWFRELKILRKSLEVFPSRFPQFNNPRLGAAFYRVALHYSHKVIFRIDEQAKTICIVRVYHSARKPLESDEDIENSF